MVLKLNSCYNFGSLISAKSECSVFFFILIILRITKFKFGIKVVSDLMDDSWGVHFSSKMVSFKSHQIPPNQAKLLAIFNLLRVPWDYEKQVSGPVLKIIGQIINSNNTSFTLPPDKKHNSVKALCALASSFHQWFVN